MSYESALFCQHFEQELHRPVSNRRRVLNAVKRLSPTATCTQLRIYADALLATMFPDGELAADWRDRVHRTH